MDHFHHRIVQHLLYQDLGPSALPSYRSTHLQQSFRYRHLDCNRFPSSPFPHSPIVALLDLRSSPGLLDGLGLHLEGIMALLRRPMVELLDRNLVCGLGCICHLAASCFTRDNRTPHDMEAEMHDLLFHPAEHQVRRVSSRSGRIQCY